MFKVVISTKDGKSYQIEKEAPTLIGMKLNQTFDGSIIGLNGYTLKVTGGSDKEGFPMRRDLSGTQRRKVLTAGGVGYRSKRKGARKRKTVRGNRIAEDVVQVNVKVEKKKKGAKKIEKILGVEETEEEKEKTKEDKGKEEKKKKDKGKKSKESKKEKESKDKEKKEKKSKKKDKESKSKKKSKEEKKEE